MPVDHIYYTSSHTDTLVLMLLLLLLVILLLLLLLVLMMMIPLPCNQFLAVGDKTVRIWDPTDETTNNGLVHKRGHKSTVRCVYCSSVSNPCFSPHTSSHTTHCIHSHSLYFFIHTRLPTDVYVGLVRPIVWLLDQQIVRYIF